MINPDGDRVVLKFPETLPLPDKSPAGAKAKLSLTTEVLEVGPDVKNKKIKPGAWVLYEDYSFFDFQVNGEKYLIGNSLGIVGFPDKE